MNLSCVLFLKCYKKYTVFWRSRLKRHRANLLLYPIKLITANGYRPGFLPFFTRENTQAAYWFMPGRVER